jgi:hypothetical protein
MCCYQNTRFSIFVDHCACCCVCLQFDPELIKAAEVAINEVINELPKQLIDEAQQFRVSRAGGKA